MHWRFSPISVNEISKTIGTLEPKLDILNPKIKFLAIINICALILEIGLTYFFDLTLITTLAIFLITSLIMVLTLGLMARIIISVRKDVRNLRERYQLFTDEMEKIKGGRIINSITRNELTDFISQRNKLGYGISLTNIKDEFELYGLKVPDVEILRAHYDFFFSSNPEGWREILTAFFADGKTHESFDELSDKEILEFIDTVKNNIENKPKVIRSYLDLYYPNPEDRREILNIYFMDGKSHENFDELSDEEVINFEDTVRKNLETIKTQENN